VTYLSPRPRNARWFYRLIVVALFAVLVASGCGGSRKAVHHYSPPQVHLTASEKAEFHGASCVFSEVWANGDPSGFANVPPAMTDCTAQAAQSLGYGETFASVQQGISKEVSCMVQHGTAGPQCVPTKRKFAVGRGVRQNGGGSSSSSASGPATATNTATASPEEPTSTVGTRTPRTYVLSPLYLAKPLVEPQEIPLLSADHVKVGNWNGWGTEVARADATYYSCPTGSPCSPIHGTLILDKRRTYTCGGRRLFVYTRGRILGFKGETLATLGLGTYTCTS